MIIRATNKRKEKKLTIFEQQKIANKLLSQANLLGTNYFGDIGKVKKVNFSEKAIIAGGAPRDWFNNKLANDIDIFVWAPFPVSKFAENLGIVTPEVKKHTSEIVSSDLAEDVDDLFSDMRAINPASEYHKMKEIEKVFEGEFEEVKYQIIILKPKEVCLHASSIKEFLKLSFDFDICKAWYEGDRVVLSDAAKNDFTNKKLTISVENLLKFKRFSTLVRRSQKIQSYFPNYQIRFRK